MPQNKSDAEPTTLTPGIIIGIVAGSLALIAIVTVSATVMKTLAKASSAAFYARQDDAGRMMIESEWHASQALADEATWLMSDDQRYEYATITPDPSMPACAEMHVRIRRFFEAGGSRGGRNRKYVLQRIELVRNETLRHAFDNMAGNLEQRISANPSVFKTVVNDDGVKLRLLSRLQQHFMPVNGLDHANILLAWHGCSLPVVSSICSHGVADLRKTDGGFFGAGACACQ